MNHCIDSKALHNRLNRIAGQINAISRMVDDGTPCEEVLSQINAAKSALHKTGQMVLEGHLNCCVREGIQHGDADETIKKFAKAIERFSNI